MKKLLCVSGGAILLAACSSQPSDLKLADAQAKADAEAHAACRNVDPPIGSHVVRRSDCGAATADESADRARHDAQTLQQQQIMRQHNAPRN
jgi:uncharacterized lipoprotein YajG